VDIEDIDHTWSTPLTTLATRPVDADSPKPIAPYWHTAIFVAVLGLLALRGWLFQDQGGSAPGPSHGSQIPLYLSVLAAEWGLLTFARKGSGLSGTTLDGLIGADWRSPRGLARDALLGVALWLVWQGLAYVYTLVFGAGHAAPIEGLLPSGPVEIVLWTAVSLSAGFCEEVAFRGYCQRQFAALTHSRWIGLLLQAIVFGFAHSYEGMQACIRITLYAVLFGLLALWRRSLRPGMIGHAFTDIVAGLFGF